MADETVIDYSGGSSTFLPIVQDPNDSTPRVLSTISSANFDGVIPYEIISSANSDDVLPGYYFEESDDYHLIIRIEDILNASDEVVAYNFWYVFGGAEVFKTIQSNSSTFSDGSTLNIRREIWTDKVIGESGWTISAEGNAIFSNVAVRGEITAESGEFAGSLSIGTDGMEIGVDVNNSSNDGIYINTDNYWYSTGEMKVGGSSSFTIGSGTSGGSIIYNGTTTTIGSDVIIQGGLTANSLTVGTSPNQVIISNTAVSGNPGIFISGSSDFIRNTGAFRLGGTNGISYSGSGTVQVSGFSVGSDRLFSGSGSTFVGLGSGSTAFFAGASSDTGTNAKFSVTSGGSLSATLGAIAGWTIGNTSITKGTVGLLAPATPAGTDIAFYAGNAIPASALFKVTYDGALTASSATVTGQINATSGTFKNTVIIGEAGTNGTLQVGTSASSGITILGTTTSTGTKIYSGTSSTYNTSSTGFYLDASGRFSLGSTLGTTGLSWSGSGGTLVVKGNITATSGSFTGDVNITSPGKLITGTTADGVTIDSTGLYGYEQGSAIFSIPVSSSLTPTIANFKVVDTTVYSDGLDANLIIGTRGFSGVVSNGTIGTVTTEVVSGTTYRMATITAMTNATNLVVGQVITATSGTGTIPSGTIVKKIISASSISIASTGLIVAGSVTNITGVGGNNIQIRGQDSNPTSLTPTTPSAIFTTINGTTTTYSDAGVTNTTTGFYIDRTGKFRLAGANGSIIMDGSGNLTATGTINAKGGNFTNTVYVGSADADNSIRLVGTATANTTAIAIGSGTLGYNTTNTKFWADGSGRFSLGDKLTWDPSSSTLSINGSGTFSGALSAATGTFSGRLQAGDIYIPNSTSPVFSVTDAGVLTATQANITGTINANNGTFTSTVTIGGSTSGTLQIGSGTNKINIVGTSLDTTTKINSGTTTSTSGSGFYFDASGKARLATTTQAISIDGSSVKITGNIDQRTSVVAENWARFGYTNQYLQISGNRSRWVEHQNATATNSTTIVVSDTTYNGYTYTIDDWTIGDHIEVVSGTIALNGETTVTAINVNTNTLTVSPALLTTGTGVVNSYIQSILSSLLSTTNPTADEAYYSSVQQYFIEDTDNYEIGMYAGNATFNLWGDPTGDLSVDSIITIDATRVIMSNIYASPDNLTISNGGGSGRTIMLGDTSVSSNNPNVNIYSNTINTRVFSGTNVVINTSSALIGRSSSSIRYKENILDVLSVPESDLLKINPISYNDLSDIQDGIENPRRYYGFIAEEIDKIETIKDLVVYNQDGDPESLFYDRIWVVMYPAFKKLILDRNDLQERVASLEERIAALEQK